MTESDIADLLRRRFGPPRYAFLTQVRNATGFPGQIRTADAIAVNLWPSHGFEVVGFEIKISKSDWERELAKPEKADEIQAYCNRWYVAAPAGVVDRASLPAGWGLLSIGKRGIKAEVKSPFCEARKPLDRWFVASVLRRAQEEVTGEAELRRAHEEGRKEGLENGRLSAQKSELELANLKKAVHDFERASGVRISEWNDDRNVGHAVRLVLDGEEGRARERLCELKNSLQDLVEAVDRVLGNGLK